MHEETKYMSSFNDIPVLLARIDDKLGIIAAWVQNGASQQDPHAILTIDEAVAFTGYSKSAIHSATSKDTIPHFKRGNKLFFFKDELVEWLRSDSCPKRGKRFQVNDNSKESVVTNGNQESVSIAAEIANNTNSVAEVIDTNSNQAEMATPVPEEAVPACQSPEILTPSKPLSGARSEQNGPDDEFKETSTESVPTSGTDVDSCMDRREDVLLSVSEKWTIVMSTLLMNTYLMIVPDSRERKILFLLFLLSLTLVLNGMKPLMASLQSQLFGSLTRYLTINTTPFAGLPRTDTASELLRTPSALSSPLMTMLFRLLWLSTNTCRQTLIIVTNVTSNSKPKLSHQTMIHSVIHTCLRHPASGISSQHCDALRESFCRNAPSSLGYWLNGGMGASLCSENFRTRCSQLGFPLCVSL